MGGMCLWQREMPKLLGKKIICGKLNFCENAEADSGKPRIKRKYIIGKLETIKVIE